MNAKLHPLVATLGMATLVFLYVPMVLVAVLSLNSAKYGPAWEGASLRWYLGLFHNEDVMEAARNTLVLALVSTAISTVLGTLLAVGMSRFPWPRPVRGLFSLIVYYPVVMPDIVFAAALVVAFGLLRSVWSVFEPGLTTMIIAHVTFQIAFVALVVHSRLATFGSTMEEAARDLYASGFYLFRRVTLPLLIPGIVAGAMLAFTLSLDDFIISFFTKGGPESTTLPIYIQAAVRRGPRTELHALSTIIFLVTVVLVLGLERLTRMMRR